MPTVTDNDIFHEPDWTKTHSHRVGLRDRDDRFPGLTHSGDDLRFEIEEEAEEKIEELRQKVERGELVTVRDFLANQKDFHIERPEVHPKHWRYVLHTTEGHIKEEQPWLINEKKHEKEQARAQAAAQEPKTPPPPPASSQPRPHEEVSEGMTLEERALLANLRSEAEIFQNIKPYDGKGYSPAKSDFAPAEIDEQDQNTPDNWVPRTDHLQRLTGKHPLNGEPRLTELFDAGLVTPNWLHYVRSHGYVPHLLWENHKLEISAGESLTLFMDDLKEQFESINLPVFVACDGTRRKELNMIKRSKGFNWGPGGMSCAYWRGVPLRDVLGKAKIERLIEDYGGVRLWVNFQGAETLSGGKYETSLPLEYVMDPVNDVLLAYEMNDSLLPADHGYPLRLVVPGFVGGRWVKWLEKIWVTDKENDSHYHIYDNRIMPGFVTTRDSDIAYTMYHHPSTACMEQNLNSVIVKPEQGEMIDLMEVRKGKMYRIQGVAYNGGGHEVQRVEVSLNGGKTWLYCIRQYPEAALRHARKFWAWLHWHVDVSMAELLRAESITVRCWDVNKSTQPENPTWNLEGQMNNCQYVVKTEITESLETGKPYLLFRHPCEPGTGEGGWMKPSAEIQAEEIRRQAAAPEKQFTREEIEKHDSEDDCWIVVNGKVYDATSVLSWHPGGKASILAHGGRVHEETTSEFESIHDDYAHQKLQECVLGVVTKKTQDYIDQEAQAKAEKDKKSAPRDSHVVLKRHRWTQARFLRKTALSKNSNRYTFALSSKDKRLGLKTGQHILIGFHFQDHMVFRSYTPVRPVFEEDEDGTFDLVVKTYYPNPGQPGGTMSNILDCLLEGEEVEIKGPTGEIVYQGNGTFCIDDRQLSFDRITLVLGGSGITPGYQVIARILLSGGEDKTKIRVIDANSTEDDILLRGDLDKFAREHPDQFQITHVVSKPGESWKGEKGFVNKRILHQYAFEPSERSIALLCGPPGLIQNAVLPVLEEWGYSEDRNMFGF